MFRRTRLHHALFALCLLAAVLVSGRAAASIGVAGTGEPRFTNSESNTVWFAYSKPATPLGQPSEWNSYRALLTFVHGATGESGATGATGTTGPLGPAGNGGAGSGEEHVQVGPGPLVEGHTYGVCALGQFDLLADQGNFTSESAGSCDDALVAGKRTSSIIDRTRPSIQVKVNNAVPFTRANVIPIRIDYTDNLAFPFPANFVCLRGGIAPATAKTQCDASTPTAPQYAYDEHCSSPSVPATSPGALINVFVCNIAAGTNTPDGPVTFCAIAADSSIPDNPTGSNQAQTADKANLSFSACGSTTLDRTPPGVVVVAPAGVRVGDSLAVSALGQDAGSGLAGVVTWGWGDSSEATTGVNATHVFTKTGTYTVTATMTDAAGNAGQATASVVATTGPAKASKVHGGTVTTKALTAAQLIKRAGAGGHVKRLAAGDFQALVPERVRLKRTGRSSIPMALAIGRKGSVSLSYTYRGRRIATAGLQITAGTAGFALRLPKHAPPGTGQLLAQFKPTGGVRTTAVLTVKLVKAKAVKHKSKKKKSKAKRASASEPFVTGAPRASLPLGF